MTKLMCLVMALLGCSACGRTPPTSPQVCTAANMIYAETTYVYVNGVRTIGGIARYCK